VKTTLKLYQPFGEAGFCLIIYYGASNPEQQAINPDKKSFSRQDT
jgi:hypothetical protein